MGEAVYVIMGLGVLFLLMWGMRELLCIYFKFSHMVDNQEKIIKVLEEIRDGQKPQQSRVIPRKKSFGNSQ